MGRIGKAPLFAEALETDRPLDSINEVVGQYTKMVMVSEFIVPIKASDLGKLELKTEMEDSTSS